MNERYPVRELRKVRPVGNDPYARRYVYECGHEVVWQSAPAASLGEAAAPAAPAPRHDPEPERFRRCAHCFWENQLAEWNASIEVSLQDVLPPLVPAGRTRAQRKKTTPKAVSK